MNYLVLKAFHLIFVVCWFAGLFYLGRLFIYFKEAELKKNSEKKSFTGSVFYYGEKVVEYYYLALCNSYLYFWLVHDISKF